MHYTGGGNGAPWARWAQQAACRCAAEPPRLDWFQCELAAVTNLAPLGEKELLGIDEKHIGHAIHRRGVHVMTSTCTCIRCGNQPNNPAKAGSHRVRVRHTSHGCAHRCAPATLFLVESCIRNCDRHSGNKPRAQRQHNPETQPNPERNPKASSDVAVHLPPINHRPSKAHSRENTETTRVTFIHILITSDPRQGSNLPSSPAAGVFSLVNPSITIHIYMDVGYHTEKRGT